MMERTTLKYTLIFLVLLSGLAWAKFSQNLSREDAARLEAFVLTENLLDFAARSNSPQAYLMAAQLMLEYPTVHEGQESRKAVQTLIERALKLAPEDEAVRLWAQRLNQQANKTTRGPRVVLERRDFRLKKNQLAQEQIEAGAQSLMLASPGLENPQLELVIKNSTGQVLTRTTNPWLTLEGEGPLTLEVRHLDSRPVKYSLLIR